MTLAAPRHARRTVPELETFLTDLESVVQTLLD